MRISRFKVPDITPPVADPSRIQELRAGNDVTLAATGILVSRALEAASLLASQGVDARVLNVAMIKPLDEETLIKAARETRAIVTVEEGIIYGGLGGAIAETVARHHPVPMRMLGFPGFCPTGSVPFLLEHFGLTAEGIAKAARDVLGSSS